MLFYLMSLAIGIQGFEILTDSTTEWFSPNYRFDETVINPLYYVESITDLRPGVASHVFFQETNSGYEWNLILVGKNKLCVINDNGVEFEMSFPFEAAGAVFSRNGSYTIIREGEHQDEQAILVDLSSGETQFFDPTPDGHICGLLLADTGDIVGVGTNYFLVFNPGLSAAEYIEYPDFSLRHLGMSAGTEILVFEDVFDSPREIRAFDWDGKPRWSIETGQMALANNLAVSDDGSLVGASFITDGFKVIDGSTGAILRDEFPGQQTSVASISQNSSRILVPEISSPSQVLRSLSVNPQGSQLEIDIDTDFEPQSGWGFATGDVCNSGSCLISAYINGPPGDDRLALIDEMGALVWCSRLWSRTERNYTISPNYYNSDYRLRTVLNRLSPDGSLIAYMDRETGQIHIIRISSDNEGSL